MEYTELQIKAFFNDLGVKHGNKANSRGWLQCLCQVHPGGDEHLGNAAIDCKSGVSHCFACGASYNLYTLVKTIRPNLSYAEIRIYLGDPEDQSVASRGKRKTQATTVSELEPTTQKPTLTFQKGRRFDPNLFDYTRLRGFTKEFLVEFGVSYVTTGYFDGYIQIPISDKSLDFETIEFRKINPTDANAKKKKVLYPHGAWFSPKKTIWNIDKLDRSQDLYVCEGIAGTPKIWTSLSKNVTALFGAAIVDSQIEILKSFNGRKIFIPDWDTASNALLYKVGHQVSNCYVLPVKDDTSEDYNLSLQETQPIELSRFMIQQYGIMDWSIK